MIGNLSEATLFVNNINEMIGKTRLYVNLANGYIYSDGSKRTILVCNIKNPNAVKDICLTNPKSFKIRDNRIFLLLWNYVTKGGEPKEFYS